MNHTPLDSLKWLADSASILEWCTEELAGVHGDTPDLEAVSAALTAFIIEVRSELGVHGGPTATYSTGHPVRAIDKKPILDRDENGVDEIFIVDHISTVYPDGRVRGLGGGHDDIA